MWLITAILSAVFAGLTSILAKCGIRNTDSDVATAIRTGVVLVFSCVMVLITGSAGTLQSISGRSMLYLILSGLATGASWICYFKALAIGNVNKVTPVDKVSTVLTVLLAIVVFHETENLALRLFFTALFGAGILLMIEKKPGTERPASEKAGMLYALAGSVFAALKAILAKIGIIGVESNLGTAVQTAVVLVMAWLIVFARGKGPQLKRLDLSELRFICLSGIATGASWLCYYHAIQNGVVSVVAPIDKMSILVTVIFSRLVFNEHLSRKAFIGLICMLISAVGMALI